MNLTRKISQRTQRSLTQWRQTWIFLFLGLFFCNGTSAMDNVVDGSNDLTHEQGEYVIPMHEYKAHNAVNNIDALKNIDLTEMILGLQDEHYLPKTVQKRSILSGATGSLKHLLYLSTIRKNENEKTPFSEKQQHKFNSAASVRNKVLIAFVVYFGIVVFTSVLEYTNLLDLLGDGQTNQTGVNQTGTANTPQTIAKKVTPATVKFLAELLAGVVSLGATGIMPDRSAREADKLQDRMSKLSAEYSKLAKYWIDISFMHPDKAREIAELYDMEALRERVKLKTNNAKLISSLIDPLEQARHFIMNDMNEDVLPVFTEVHSYIRNKRNAQTIGLLSNRVDDLERSLRDKEIIIHEI